MMTAIRCAIPGPPAVAAVSTGGSRQGTGMHPGGESGEPSGDLAQADPEQNGERPREALGLPAATYRHGPSMISAKRSARAGVATVGRNKIRT